MSLAYNDTTTYKGIVQIYEKEIGANRGDVSGNTTKLKELTADVNLAFDDFVAIALQASGAWQYDDSNHTDYPIITTSLVDGQRDYTFATDEGGNLILDIYRVFVKDTNGTFIEIYPVDQQSDMGTESLTDGLNYEAVPYRYDKTGNGIFLDPIPSYNSSGGLKVFINREPSYFTYTDTTKKPGVPGIFHRYFALKPALDYARRNNLTNYNAIQNEVVQIEQAIEDHFGRREKDNRPILKGKPLIFK